MHRKINPPSQDDVTAEHRALYVHRNMKSVASYAGEKAYTYSRKLNVEEEKSRDHLYETVMEMYASVVSDQPEIGREILAIINRFAGEFGLLGHPIDILDLATQRLRDIRPEDIQKMSADGITNALAQMAILENELDALKPDLVNAKSARIVRRVDERERYRDQAS